MPHGTRAEKRRRASYRGAGRAGKNCRKAGKGDCFFIAFTVSGNLPDAGVHNNRDRGRGTAGCTGGWNFIFLCFYGGVVFFPKMGVGGFNRTVPFSALRFFLEKQGRACGRGYASGKFGVPFSKSIL